MASSTNLRTAIAAVLGVAGSMGGLPAAQADSLTGEYTDATGTTTRTGTTISASSSDVNLTLGLQDVGASFVGDIPTGVMSATSSASNTPSTSQITYSTTITNTSATVQSYVIDINIGNSVLTTVSQFSYPDGNGSAAAAISADVLVNLKPVFDSTATLSFASGYSAANPNPYTLLTTGPAFTNGTVVVANPTTGPYNGTDYEQVSFGAFTDTVSLGSLAPGQSENVLYVLGSSAKTVALAGYGFAGYGGAVASVGDPFAVAGSPGFLVTTAVPEPQTYAMMAAGLALVAGMTRRRKKHPA